MTRTALPHPRRYKGKQAPAPRRQDENRRPSAPRRDETRSRNLPAPRDERRDEATVTASTQHYRNEQIIDDDTPTRRSPRREGKTTNGRHAPAAREEQSDETPRQHNRPRITRRTDTMGLASTPNHPSPKDMGNEQRDEDRDGMTRSGRDERHRMRTSTPPRRRTNE